MARQPAGILALCARNRSLTLGAVAAAVFSATHAGCAHAIDADWDFLEGGISAGGSSSGGSGGLGTAGRSGSASGSGTSTMAGGGSGGSGGSSVVDASGGAPPTDASGDMAQAGGAGARDAAPDVLCPSGGMALTFDGVSSRLTIPGGALPAGNRARTIELWMKIKAAAPEWSPNHTVFEYGAANAAQGFGLDMDMFPMMEVYVHPASSSLVFAAGITQEQWFHVAATYDANNLRAFINGVEKGTKMLAANLATTTTPLNVGAGNARYFFNGSIDEVRVWSVARTGLEILRTMSMRLMGNEAGLVGYWRFDDGNGNTARDVTPAGNHATLTGTTLPQWSPSGVTLGCP